MAYTDEEVESWITDVSVLHSNSPDEFIHAAEEAAANLLSGSGAWFLDVPTEVQTMISQLIQAGYAQALCDVRDGEFDDEVAAWRSELA
jgi:hypothetical protein